MSFNPITNQPLVDYKIMQEKMQKEMEDKIKNLNNQDIKGNNYNSKIKQNERVPVEYNPYKHPYSQYKGHP